MLSSSNLWVTSNNQEDNYMSTQNCDEYWSEFERKLEADAAANQCNKSRMDIIGQNGNDGLHYEDPAVNPSHYKSGNIECIDYIVDTLGPGAAYYCQGNVTKYLHRWEQKGGVQDLKKAKWYLEKMIEIKETNTPT